MIKQNNDPCMQEASILYFLAAILFNDGGDFPVTCSPTKSDALITNKDIKYDDGSRPGDQSMLFFQYLALLMYSFTYYYGATSITIILIYPWHLMPYKICLPFGSPC